MTAERIERALRGELKRRERENGSEAEEEEGSEEKKEERGKAIEQARREERTLSLFSLPSSILAFVHTRPGRSYAYG